MATDSFDSAVEALHSDLHISKTKQALERSSSRRRDTLSEMAVYMDRIGCLRPKHTLRILHIAGTKGKGSVACMCEAILRQQNSNCITGLFTSPHLVDIRERIRIQGKPMSRSLFGETYWELRRRLEDYHQTTTPQKDDAIPTLPGYFRMLTLMAFFVFTHYEAPISNNPVLYWILEVGMGGRYDATKAFHHLLNQDSNADSKTRIACGVTLIDYDHMRVLGNTLEEIAWEKGGVFESGTTTSPPVSCFVLDTNTPSVLKVLRDCAAFRVVQEVGEKTHCVSRSLRLGLPGKHQYANAEMAVALCRAISDEPITDASIQTALETASWPGRCQKLSTDTMSLYLDGAHTVESIRSGIEWFSSCHKETNPTRTVLLFYCGHEKNPIPLFQDLFLHHVFDLVIFTRASSERPSAQAPPSATQLLSGGTMKGEVEDERWEATLTKVWKALVEDDQQSVECFDSVELALGRIEKEPSAAVFVTGSLYLVGSVLETIKWKEPESEGSLNYKS